jgi:hypothetical protein
LAEAPPLQLADLQLPSPLGWWPPAPGWWLLATLVLLLALGGWFYRQRQRGQIGTKQLRAAALSELEQHYVQYQYAENQAQYQDAQKENPGAHDQGRNSRFIQQVSALLKRVTLLHHDPAQVAHLSGEQWADFLTDGQSEPCRAQIRALLGQSYSASSNALDAEPLYQFALQWIESKEAFQS